MRWLETINTQRIDCAIDNVFRALETTSAERQVRAILHALPGLRSELMEMLVAKKAVAEVEAKDLVRSRPDGLRVTIRNYKNRLMYRRLSRTVDLLAHLIVVTSAWRKWSK